MHPQAKHSVKHCYEFGPFRLDAGERLLYRSGEVVPLTSKISSTSCWFSSPTAGGRWRRKR